VVNKDVVMGKLILILGGVRSGKSMTAEQMAQQIGGERVLYVATAEGNDEEMRERIAAHREKRPVGWLTIEAPMNVANALRGLDLPDVVLLDCVTLLASNLLLTLPEDCTQAAANQPILDEIEALLLLVQSHAVVWIVVSNEVGMGIVPPSRLGRLYRDALGIANQRLAQAADEVILMVAGLPWHLKGR
jgi:adenosylcobinamide kinase / adenosylcobinamide-phosphate guanylyltransferase